MGEDFWRGAALSVVRCEIAGEEAHGLNPWASGVRAFGLRVSGDFRGMGH